MTAAGAWLARRAHAREAPQEAERIKIERSLRAARIPIAARDYRRLGVFVSAAAGAGSVMLVAGILVVARVPPLSLVIVSLCAGIFGLLFSRVGLQAYIAIRATGRARRIEAEFHDVVILCYALAKGGVTAIDVFRAVAAEKETYGPISDEFAMVVHGVEWFGRDINTSLEDAAGATPSTSLRAFFTGLVAILNSGAEPKDYFHRQAELLLQASDTRVERELEQSGLLAESYVSGLLVLPLLLIIVIAVMSVFGGGKAGLMKSIVFLFIPIGTLAYAILVDTLLPSEPLGAPAKRPPPVTDFGLDVAPRRRDEEIVVTMGDRADDAANGPAEEIHGLSGRIASAKRRAAAAWKRYILRARSRPVEGFVLSLPVAFLILAGGGTSVWLSGLRGDALATAITNLAVLAGLVAVVPVAIFHEMRTRFVRRVEGALPETLSKLSGLNDRGISILQAFKIVGRSATGPLTRELRSFDRDVSWNHHLRDALMRLRQRVATPRVTRLSILLERASSATSDLKEVLEVAAQNANRTEAMRARKRQGMMSYVVVIYVVFAVFLYVTFMVTDLFYGANGLGAVTSGVGTAPGLSKGIASGEARVLFFQSVLIQGACCGIVAGRLGEGYVLSGLKHAAILVVGAWAVFALGVF